MSQTGANADEWVPATPGSEGVLAFAIARVLVDGGLRPASRMGAAAATFERWKASPEAAPESVEQATGVSTARIERLAKQFAEQTPSVAIVGGAPLAQSNGLFTAIAVNALNSLNGSIDTPGGIYFTPQPGVVSGFSRTPDRAVADLVTTPPQLLLIDGANPVHVAPPSVKLRDALVKVPFIVSFGQFLDETSGLADLILPDHSVLEQWSDAIAESGSLTAAMAVAPPVMLPLYDTRAPTDLLLDVGRRLRKPVDLGAQTFEEVLAASFMTLPSAVEGVDAWTDAQEKGGWWGALPTAQAAPGTSPGARSPEPGADPTPSSDGDPAQFPLQLLPYPSSMFLDGSLAHLPWMQETPDPITSAMWSSWIEINSATAQKMGISTGDVVEVASSQGTLQTAAYVSPGIAPGVVAMPMGQGHTMFTRFATGRGVNPAALLARTDWAATRVKVTRVSGPDGRLILFAGGDRDHDQQHEYGHAGRG